MRDRDEEDTKIIAIPMNDPTWSGYKDISELPPHIMQEMTHFFTVYKNLEKGKQTAVMKVEDAKKARKSIEKAIKAYQERFMRL